MSLPVVKKAIKIATHFIASAGSYRIWAWYMYIQLYSKKPLIRPNFELPKSGFICKVVLISNIISLGKYRFGLANTDPNNEVFSGVSDEILLYFFFLFLVNVCLFIIYINSQNCLLFNWSHDVAVIQFIASCHKHRMTTCVITLWWKHVTSLTTFV